MRRVSWCVGALGVMLVGCKTKPPGFIGVWESNTSPSLDAKKAQALTKLGMKQTTSKARFTFNADQTMSFSASEQPGQKHYVLTGMGTWSATEKELTVVPATMKLTELPDNYIKKLQPYIDKIINKPQTGNFQWKGPDEFILTRPDAAPQDFKRVK